MTGLYSESIKVRTRKARADVEAVAKSLHSLKNQDSGYAREHRALLDVLQDVLHVYEKAKEQLENEA